MPRIIFAILALATVILFDSCKKEEFEKGPFALEFSEDTILFDTVFTTVGSATQVFLVYNNGDKDVKINSISIAGGSASNFRLNVDGIPGKSFTNVEIGANDSIWIFAEVTVDPNSGTTPLVITDSIIFNTNGLIQDVDLVAWGQDAYFHRQVPNSPLGPFFFLNCNEIWDSLKPHVVYGYALVDSGCTLTVNAGTKVHFHPGAGLIVLNTGTLLVNGALGQEVVFQGDRLGEQYKDVPGQWDRIWLSNWNLYTNIISPGTRNSVIRHAIIKNGTIGLLVDTAFNDNPNTRTLLLENTIIKNMSSHAIACRGAKVDAYNCVFANSGAQVANLLFGGDYNFLHCTFANYWNNGNRQDPSITLSNYYLNTPRALTAYFGNSIIYGNNENEFGIDSIAIANQLDFLFENCLLKVESAFPTGNTLRYKDIIKATGNNNDPLFADFENNDYQLDSASSPAINAGSPAVTATNPVLSTDLLGNPRPIGLPDMGAYERR